MIKHKVIELRTFDDCSPELKKKILDKYRHWETESCWVADMECDCMSDMLEKEYGFKCTAKDIEFDISCSQGSGASFTCYDFDWNKLLEGLDIKHKKWWCAYLESCGMKIVTHNHHYCHSQTKHWDTDNCDLDYIYAENKYPHLSKEFDKIMEYLEDIRLKACNKMYEAIQADYEYYESDEYLSQMFTDNEFLFNEEGEIDYE